MPVEPAQPSSLLDTFQSIPLNTLVTAGAAGFVAFAAGLAFARGVVRQLVGMASVGISVSVAWFVFRHRMEVFGSIAPQLSTDRLLLFSAGAGLLTYFICKGLVHLLAMAGLANALSGLTGWKGVALSILPSGFLLWVAAMGLRLVGNLYGLETASAVAREGSRLQDQVGSVWDQISRTMDRSLVGGIAQKMDPFDMRATANLARLLILWPEKGVWQRLEKDPKVRRALGHPKLQSLATDAEVRRCIERRDFAGLFQLRQVEQVASLPDLQPALGGLQLEEAMDAVIYRRR